MLLLDFPPEVFDNIVHELVYTAGASSAWELRQVCHTFKAAIMHDIFARQPLTSFQGVNQAVLRNNLGLYLYYRSKARLDVHHYVPDTINKMIEYLAGELGTTGRTQKEELRRNLCDTLGKIGCFGIFKALRGNQTLQSAGDLSVPFGAHDRLVAALCFGNYILVRKLLKQLPDYKPHPVFGSHLHNTALLGQEPALKAIMEHFGVVLQDNRQKVMIRNVLRPRYYANRHTDAGFCVHSTVFVAISRGHGSIVRYLTHWYAKHVEAFTKREYNGFLNRAIPVASVEVVKAILDMPYVQHRLATRVTWPHFQLTCSKGRPDVLQLFLSRGHINPNDGSRITTPLLEAVRSNHLAVVRVLLNAGADANVCSSFKNKTVPPIFVAMKKKNPEIVQCLLDSSAHLPNISEWTRHQKTYEVLRQAKTRKGGGQVPVFTRFKNMRVEELQNI